MKFKIDENLSPSLAKMFDSCGHEAHSAVQEALGGQPDLAIIDVCSREQRALITSDYWGIVVFRLANQAHVTIEAALRRVLDLLPQERRIRIHG